MHVTSKTIGSARSSPPSVEGPSGPLTASDLASFRRCGWVVLRGAFDPTDLAAYAESELAQVQQESAQDPAAVARHHLPKTARSRFDVKARCPRLHAAICQVVGGEARLQSPLAGFSNCIARPKVQCGSSGSTCFDWHVDGWHEPHRLTSPEVGLVCLWLLTPAPPGGGGTVVAEGSAAAVARALARAGPAGLPPAALHAADAAPEHSRLIPRLLRTCPKHESFVGEAGDAALCHPLLLHRGAANTAAARPRILAVSHCPLASPLRRRAPRRRPEPPLSPVEQCIADALDGPYHCTLA